MQTKTFTLFLTTFLSVTTAFAQLEYVWVDSLNAGSYAGGHSSDLKIDAEGNIYTLAFEYDTALVKYDPSGELLWIAPYPGSVSQPTTLKCIQIAGDGSVYVVGSGYEHVVALKYSSGGDLIWSKAYFNSAQSQFYHTYAAVASDDALLIATTETIFNGDSNNIFVLKYSSPGNLEWDYQLPSTGLDYAFAIDIDGNDDVLVTGVINYHFNPFSDFTGGDLFLLKISNNGVLDWESFFDSPDTSFDKGAFIVNDADNNYYVTGWSKKTLGGNGNTRLIALKFDHNGSLIWADSILSAVQHEYAGSLYLLNNKLFLTGAKLGDAGQHVLNACFDVSGNLLWQHIHSSSFGYALSACSYSVLTKRKTILNLIGEYNSDPSFPKSTLFELDTAGNFINSWKLDSLDAFHYEFEKIQQAETGEFYLRGKTDNGGVNYGIITAKIKDVTVSIRNPDGDTFFNLFPNPCSSEILVSTNLTSFNNAEVVISDLAGRKRLNSQLLKTIQRFNISSLPPGIYLLQLKTSTETISKKFSIIR